MRHMTGGVACHLTHHVPPFLRCQSVAVCDNGGGWALSAVVAQQLYTLLVGGSNPSAPTMFP